MTEESRELSHNMSADHTALKGLRPVKDSRKPIEEERCTLEENCNIPVFRVSMYMSWFKFSFGANF